MVSSQLVWTRLAGPWRPQGPTRRGIKLSEASPMSGVFQNIDPPTPSPPVECVPPPPPPLVRGEDTLAGGRGGGGSKFWKTPDTVLYSTYVSTLWPNPPHYLSLSLASPLCSIRPPGNALSHVMSTVLYSTCTKVRLQLYSFSQYWDLTQLSQNPKSSNNFTPKKGLEKMLSSCSINLPHLP
jgi:hypothetical protein